MSLRLVQFLYGESLGFLARSESEFQNHEDIYDLFYTCFACLSAHFVSLNANNCKYFYVLSLENISSCRKYFKSVIHNIKAN